MRIEILHIDDCTNWREAGCLVSRATKELACRVYRVDGRFVGTPDAGQLRAAIEHAAQTG